LNFLEISKRIIRNYSLINLDNKVPFYLRKSKFLPSNFIRLEPWEMEYLFMLSSYSNIGILETGRYNGGSAVVMACANEFVPIYSVDINPQNDDFLSTIFDKLNIGSNVRLITGDSQNTKYPEVGKLDLLFIDADHSFNGCLNDLNNFYPNLISGGHIVLHDTYFGSEVQKAAISFINNNNVEVVISPYKIKSHFKYPDGSLCHFIKRD
jgi:predicted O-methyltransferase YrrM